MNPAPRRYPTRASHHASLIAAAALLLALPFFCGPEPRAQATELLPSEHEPSESIHLELGAPVDAGGSDDFLIKRPQYALSYSHVRNAANWVAWELDGTEFGNVHRHRGHFLTDDSLPPDFLHVEHSDYSRSGYDRGHMVPSDDRTATVEDNTATFLLTNVLPQRHDVNDGPWVRFENFCHHEAAQRDKQLFIVAGGIFPSAPQTIGRGVAVPQAFFKVAAILERGQGASDVSEATRVISIIVPNDEGIREAHWETYRTSVADVEARTGYALLSRVRAEVRAKIEPRVDDGATDEN